MVTEEAHRACWKSDPKELQRDATPVHQTQGCVCDYQAASLYHVLSTEKMRAPSLLSKNFEVHAFK